jgi:myo-inositol-1(or 4)-monophosphatase
MIYATLARELAAHIRSAVRPLIGTPASRDITGTASSGDATFRIDNVAEDAVVQFITERKLDLAVYTEDEGLKSFGVPEATLIIHPIDGTRGAAAGFECCVVSVAVARYSETTHMSDVVAGCIHEIKQDRVFVAEKGHGAHVYENGAEITATASTVTDITRAAWTAEVAGRPVDQVATVLRRAFDASSVTGGFFVLNSTAFSLSRLVNGQLSTVVDVGGRLLREAPDARSEFSKAGNGRIIGLFPYDFAAAAFIAQEAGCMVTDAEGRPLDDVNLLDSSEGSIQSILAASTPELHSQFLSIIDDGFRRLSIESSD